MSMLANTCIIYEKLGIFTQPKTSESTNIRIFRDVDMESEPSSAQSKTVHTPLSLLPAYSRPTPVPSSSTQLLSNIPLFGGNDAGAYLHQLQQLQQKQMTALNGLSRVANRNHLDVRFSVATSCQPQQQSVIAHSTNPFSPISPNDMRMDTSSPKLETTPKRHPPTPTQIPEGYAVLQMLRERLEADLERTRQQRLSVKMAVKMEMEECVDQKDNLGGYTLAKFVQQHPASTAAFLQLLSDLSLSQVGRDMSSSLVV